MANKFIDFQELKEKVSFADAIGLLDLKLRHSGNQWRGPCPTCRSGGDRALVVTEGRGFYCWGVRKGGDQIALAAHVLELPAKDAAQALAEKAGIVPVPPRNSTSGTVRSGTVPASEGEAGSKLAPLSYLEAGHEAVLALGFDPAFCERHGIGYAPRGLMRGTIAIPFRDADGILLGYIGVEDCRIPPDFTTNVVPLRKRA